MESFDTLPNDLATYFVNLLDAKSLVILSRVSKRCRALVSNKPNIIATEFGYKTIEEIFNCRDNLLEMACSKGNLKLVQLLIDLGTSVNQFFNHEGPEYTDINSFGDPIVRRIINLDTPLTLAVKSGDISVVKLLLKSGADPNQESEYREIVLYFSPPASCVLSDSINKYAIAKILLQYNAKPENFGIVHSALDFAVEGNDSELVKILFEKGECELNPCSFGKLLNLNLEGLSIYGFCEC